MASKENSCKHVLRDGVFPKALAVWADKTEEVWKDKPGQKSDLPKVVASKLGLALLVTGSLSDTLSTQF